jgi:hypothetical protein
VRGGDSEKGGKNSSNPTEWSADAEASKTAAADALAKKKTHGVSADKPAKEDWKGIADAGELDAQVTRIRAGEGYPAVLGPRPTDGTPERKKWEAAKVRIWKAVQKHDQAKAAKKK